MKGFWTLRISVASVLLLAALTMSARGRYARTEVTHYIRLSGDFAYARANAQDGYAWDAEVPMSLREAKSIIGSGMVEDGVSGNGFAPGLGIGYRLAYGALRFDVGIGAEYRQLYLQPNDLTNAYARGRDEEGVTYMGYHSWTRRTAVMQHAGINLPVMIGGEWNGVCVLAGVKTTINVWGTSAESGAYSLKGAYDRYMDPFVGMDNHGFVSDQPYRCEPVPQTVSYELRACLEVGYCFHGAEQIQRRARGRSKSHVVKCYVSAFGEYGIAGSEGIYTPLLLGARLTMLLPLPKGRECTCWKF